MQSDQANKGARFSTEITSSIRHVFCLTQYDRQNRAHAWQRTVLW